MLTKIRRRFHEMYFNHGPSVATDQEEKEMNDVAFSLYRAMQRLWTDHVVWTRHYVIAAVDNRPEIEAATTRLLKNQEDIGGTIVPFYGADAGARLTELLKQHILIAVDLVAAAKSGDSEQFATHDKRWDDNAADIAEFLSSANSFWPKKDVVDLLSLHLTLTKDEAVARLEKEYERDAAIFDQILTEILTLADALSEGITKQFPEKFAVQGA